MLYQLYLANVKCGGCANTIRRTVTSALALPLDDITIDPSNGLLTFQAENLSETDLAAVKNALNKAGYPEAGGDNTLGNKVKSFVSCAIGRLDKES